MRQVKRVFASVLLALWSGCTLPADEPPDSPEENAIESLFAHDMAAQGAIGGVLLVVADGHTEAPVIVAEKAIGTANLKTGRAMEAGALFRYASISKTYIAMMLVKLHLEGRLDLADKLTGHFPGGDVPYLPPELVPLIPHAGEVSLGSLLDHSCSLYDYRDDGFTAMLLGNPFRPLDETGELVAGLRRGLAAGAAPTSCSVFYSNSNTVVAGIVMDRLFGHHHSIELRRILAEKMGLEQTYYEKHFALDHQPDLEGLVHSYVDLGGPELLDVTWADDGYGFANGGLVGTPMDLARFYSIVFSEEHPAPMDTLEAKRSFLQIFATPNEHGLAPGNVVNEGYHFHAGQIGGYGTLALYSPARKKAIVFHTNDGFRFPNLRFEIAAKVRVALDE